jgi:hypothetical protein
MRTLYGIPFVFVVALADAAATCRAAERAFEVVGVVVDDQALRGAHDVELQGRYGYVPGKGGSLAVIDVAEPTQPKIVWSRRDPAELTDAETVLPAGDHLFLGTQDFFTLDVRSPSQPQVLTKLVDRPRIDRINGFVRIRDFVFAANKSGYLDAFDVSRPTQPRLADARNVAERDGMGDPHDVDRLGELIVIVDPDGFGRRNVPGRVGVYRVFDSTGKLMPSAEWQLVGRCEHPSLVGGNRVRTIGRFAFVAASISPEAVDRNLKQPCVGIIDLTRPEAPEFVTAIPFPDDRGPNGMCASGNVIFACGGRTVMAVDVSEPRTPRRLAAEVLAEVFQDKAVAKDDGHDLIYRDGYLYVSGQTTNSFGVVRVVDLETRRLAEGR